VVKLWVEIHDVDSEEASKPPIEIQPAPILEYEIRVVVWKTRDVDMMDIEGTSDVFIRCYFDTKDDKFTDTHWRSQDGKASFNYRMLFPIKTNRPDYVLTLQAWDKDIIASNDLIGQCQLDIDYLVKDACLTHTPRYINSRYFAEHMQQQLQEKGSILADKIKFDSEEKDRFWVPVHRVNPEAPCEKIESGQVMISVAVIPKAAAEKQPQGIGRSEPNSDPFCPEPEGRIKMSINPFDMYKQLIGPAMRR